MKISIFSDTFEQSNGVADHVRGTAEYLSKEHDVTVYTGSGRTNGFKVVNLRHWKFPLQPDYEYIRLGRVSVDCDVSHSHSPFCTSKLAFKTGKPTVTTTHTIPQHLLEYIHLGILTPFAWKYLIKFHNKSDYVVCQTDSTQSLFKKHGLKKPSSVISTGLDVSKFEKADARKFREKYGIDGDFILSANRFSPEKRVDWIFRACSELGIPCVSTSDGPLFEKMKKEFPEVNFLGKIPKCDVAGAFSAAEAFAITSRVETEGIVVNEAMASMTPVIATNLPCIADTVKDGENGFLFDSYADFKMKINELWNDKRKRIEFSAKAFENVREKDYSVVSKKLVSVYESLV